MTFLNCSLCSVVYSNAVCTVEQNRIKDSYLLCSTESLGIHFLSCDTVCRCKFLQILCFQKKEIASDPAIELVDCRCEDTERLSEEKHKEVQNGMENGWTSREGICVF